MSRRQEGAALIVGLVMLSIITLLAITGLNTSSTELIMAGNEQFRERALQAADAGIERAARVLASVPQNGIAKPDSGSIAAQPEDTYAITSTYIGTDDDIPGFSSNQFAGYHYRIVSTGQSRRNARSVHEQGAYVLGGSGAGGGNVEWLPGAEAP